MIKRKLSNSSALLAAGTMFAALGSAYAAETVETVVVTGSRIPMTNLVNPSPLSSKDAAAIEMSSARTLEDVLNTIPGPDTLGTSNTSNNGGIGQNNVSLRGLGVTRTLVLIDGQRLVPSFTGTTAVPDLNSVPLSMVERVEVLRDGASSVYGADAIGGVVNIITKRDFEGLQFDVDGGVSEHGGGENYSLSATMGLNLDKGNVTINVSNDWTAAVGQWQRNWSTRLIDRGLRGSIMRGQVPTLMDSNTGAAWYNSIATDVGDPALAAAVPCTNFVNGEDFLNASCRTPEGGWNTLQGSLGRTQMSMSGHYDITPDVTFILQGTFTDRRSGQQLRPEPLLATVIATTNTSTGATVFPGFFVPADPHWGFVPNAEALILDVGGAAECPDPTGCILAFDTPIQFGPRTYRQTSETYRIRAGFEGTLFSDYHWEAGYVQQRNETTNKVFNTGNFYHLAQALGQLPCVDVPGGCVFSPAFGYNIPITPPNFYNEPNHLTAEQVKYLTYTQIDQSHSNENYAYADVHGPLFDLPWSGGGTVQAATGVERRFEGLADSPDALVQLGYAPNFATPTSGHYGVTSVYGELQIPLLTGVPFAKNLDITPSARYDHYSTFGDATTWKIGANWAIDDNIRFRGTYSTGFRAPNVAELFGGTVVSDNTVSGDPCDIRAVGTLGSSALNTNMAATAAEALARLQPGTTCSNALLALGINPLTFKSPENSLPTDQRGVVFGGNPNLQPEKSFGFNIGAVLTPTFLPGFSFAGDYYETTVKNAIQGGGGIPIAVGLDEFINQCYVRQIVSSCAAITRTSQGIIQISGLNANFGANHVTGMELEAVYDTAAGDLELPIPGSLVIDTTLVREFTNIQLAPTGDIHQTGTFNKDAELNYPAYRVNLSVDWNLENLSVHWDTRYQSGTRNVNGTPDTFGKGLPDYFVHDISFSYDLTSMFGDKSVFKATRLIFGIHNVFDKDPPWYISDSICKCNSFAGGGYDFLGRAYYIRLTEKM